ncbi:septum formation family protein [Kibdelosporangium persicum]|uniref:Septum formation n=1 Tax=Kibdelosporangium persicum TaxID=2698649 RepID=A0ABX2EYW2_9PSEU|nr:septum formation family protein [Kibdelosporangium persicum]NRN63902.1 Septum formation [Kibdelosporangium persicum]
MRIAWRLAVGTALLGIAACEPAATPQPPPAATSGRITVPGNMYGANPPKPGQCLDTRNASVVDCAGPHDAEVINTGKLTATTMPDEATAATLTIPPCREKMAEYLGSPDMDATNLVAMPLWPNDQQWARGERWLLCTVAEVGADEKPLHRTGSLEGALQGNEFFRFQTCSVSSPSREARVRRGPCDGPHLGEALPGVISLGRPGSPMPGTDAMNKIAGEKCPGLVARYLGGNSGEVSTAWRLPNGESWNRGYTNLVCYAEASRPVRVRLRNLGQGPLPG